MPKAIWIVAGDDSVVQTNLRGGWPIVLDPNELLVKALLPVFPSHILTTVLSPRSIPPDNIKETFQNTYKADACSLGKFSVMVSLECVPCFALCRHHRTSGEWRGEGWNSEREWEHFMEEGSLLLAQSREIWDPRLWTCPWHLHRSIVSFWDKGTFSMSVRTENKIRTQALFNLTFMYRHSLLLWTLFALLKLYMTIDTLLLYLASVGCVPAATVMFYWLNKLALTQPVTSEHN